jgi:hypothetical protein
VFAILADVFAVLPNGALQRLNPQHEVPAQILQLPLEPLLQGEDGFDGGAVLLVSSFQEDGMAAGGSPTRRSEAAAFSLSWHNGFLRAGVCPGP